MDALRRPHGLVGQWFAKKAKIHGNVDKLPLVGEYTARAQAEGAIEGSVHDYIVAAPYATDFRYSRFATNDRQRTYGLKQWRVAQAGHDDE